MIKDTPISNHSKHWLREMREMESDWNEEVLPTVAPQMVPTIKAPVREPFAELDSYRTAEARLLRDCNETPFLMRRQAS
jgi:hypothetical protein